MTRPWLLTALGAGAAAVATAAARIILRHRGGGAGRAVPGGILIRDARAYDALSHRLLLRPLHARIALDVAAAAPPGARVLEVGCGPGHLAVRLAGRLGLEVTGLDLDPAMVERATANAARTAAPGGRPPSFLVGDAAALPFADTSFDLVISTLSLHHWADPGAGLAEIARVLRPGGRALLWDVRPGAVPMHRHMADPIALARSSPLQVVAAGPWRWPGRIRLLVRMELLRPLASTAP